MASSWFRTKREAVAAIKAAGFTEHLETSSSGDYAFGSREYFTRPNPPLNEHGYPLERASASKVCGQWAIDLGKD